MSNKTASGLTISELSEIAHCCQAYSEIADAALFGSRTKGTQKRGSDVDIALMGNSVSYETAIAVSERLNEESALPYFFDVIAYNRIDNKALIDHIDRVGISLFNADQQI